jgi:hypothetical protein
MEQVQTPVFLWGLEPTPAICEGRCTPFELEPLLFWVLVRPPGFDAEALSGLGFGVETGFDFRLESLGGVELELPFSFGTMRSNVLGGEASVILVLPWAFCSCPGGPGGGRFASTGPFSLGGGAAGVLVGVSLPLLDS